MLPKTLWHQNFSTQVHCHKTITPLQIHHIIIKWWVLPLSLCVFGHAFYSLHKGTADGRIFTFSLQQSMTLFLIFAQINLQLSRLETKRFQRVTILPIFFQKKEELLLHWSCKSIQSNSQNLSTFCNQHRLITITALMEHQTSNIKKHQTKKSNIKHQTSKIKHKKTSNTKNQTQINI